MIIRVEADTVSAVAAAIAAACAVIALPIALWANRMSRRALSLAQYQAQHQDAALVVHVLDVFAKVDDAGDREIVVSALVSNPSSTPSAIARSELQVEHIAGDRLIRLLLPTMNTQNRNGSGKASALLTFQFEAHGASPIEFRFQLPASLVDVTSIRRYSLLVSDSRGRVQSTTLAIMKEVAFS